MRLTPEQHNTLSWVLILALLLAGILFGQGDMM